MGRDLANESDEDLAAACLRSEAYAHRRECEKDGVADHLSAAGRELADAYVGADSDVEEELLMTALDDPERAWRVLLAAIDAAPDDVLLNAIGCGMLEEFIVECGADWIEELEREAVRSIAFGRTLSAVWLDEQPDLARRLRRYVREPHLAAFAEYHWHGDTA